MAYINILSITSSSIRVNIGGLSTDYSYNDRVCIWSIDGIEDGRSKLSAGVSSGGAYTFSGLKSNTQYDIDVEIFGAQGMPGYTVTLSETARTSSVSGGDDNVPEPWYWNTSNGNASATLTKQSYNALMNKNTTTRFSHIVWNDMCDKIVEIREYLGFSSWNNTYGSYENTKMDYYDKILTASRFNALRYNVDTAIDASKLGNNQKTGISLVSKGDPVYAWYFTTITDCINKLI